LKDIASIRGSQKLNLEILQTWTLDWTAGEELEPPFFPTNLSLIFLRFVLMRTHPGKGLPVSFKQTWSRAFL
jgi:hypothetical protein